MPCIKGETGQWPLNPTVRLSDEPEPQEGLAALEEKEITTPETKLQVP